MTWVGLAGYMLIENYTFIEALYMTIITEATVGFGEVNPLSEAGQIFTIFLIIFSFGVFAFAVSSITNFFTGGEYKIKIQQLNFSDMMNQISNHTIVCGYGRVGKKSADELLKQNLPVVIIENTEKEINATKTVFIEGDATLDENLLKAGITKAANIIVALPSDSDNLMIIVTARAMNAKINIISRVSVKSNESKLMNAGANHIISPDAVGGKAMARMVLKPDLMEFTDKITSLSDDEEDVLEEIVIENLNEKKYISHFGKDFLAGCVIIGYKSQKGELIVNPSPETEISNNTKLFVLGKKEQLNKVRKNISAQ